MDDGEVVKNICTTHQVFFFYNKTQALIHFLLRHFVYLQA